MSHLNIYDFTVPQLIHMLNTMSHVLTKSTSHPDASSFPSAALYEDMKPLTFQVQTASNMAKLLLPKVLGKEPLTFANDEKTFEDMQTRIQKTIEYLETAKREDFEGKEGIEVEFLGNKMPALMLVNRVILPNFYFHVTTCYDVLRSRGVPLGKMDFLYGNQS